MFLFLESIGEKGEALVNAKGQGYILIVFQIVATFIFIFFALYALIMRIPFMKVISFFLLCIDFVAKKIVVK